VTALQFTGSTWWVALAIAAAAMAVVMYRRERSPGGGPLVLPAALRAITFALVALMATGPVLRHRRRVGDPLQVRIVLDQSTSMALTDPQMETGRKLQIAHQLGWIDASGDDTAVLRAADELRAALDTLDGSAADRPAAIRAAAERIEAAQRLLANLPSGTLEGLRPTGRVTLERWTGLPGDRVTDLTGSPKFRGPPDERRSLTALEVPDDGTDAFGERIRGYLVPPLTGDYVFWLSSDDHAELRISPSGDPDRATTVARVEGWTSPGQWEQFPDQKSRRVTLEAGRLCYVEVLHKEGGGQAHVAVQWQLPDGTIESPVPGSRLVAWENSGADDPRAALERDLCEPARRLAAERGAAPPSSAWRREAAALESRLAIWEHQLREVFLRRVDTVDLAAKPAWRAALDRFDRTPRWERAIAALWAGRQPLLASLAEDCDLHVLALREGRLEEMWSARSGPLSLDAPPPAATAAPSGLFTDLSAIGAGLGAEGGEAGDVRAAVVLLSDGRHNRGASPLESARVLGARGVPVMTVSVGSDRPPPDAALLGVDVPESVFHRDRLRGQILVADHRPGSTPLTLRLRSGHDVLWSQETQGSGTRAVEFEVPVEELAARLLRTTPQGSERAGVRLDFTVELAGAEHDAIPENNAREISVFAVTRPYRVLLLDGRPRWETRYVRSLFDRDPRWELTALYAQSGELPRGEGSDQFPADREALMAMDLVILGDVPPGTLRPVELEWLRDFVGDRGGGLVLLEGHRGHLRSLCAGPLSELAPVEWIGESVEHPTALRLTPAGEQQPAVSLAPTGSAAAAWAQLAPPLRLAAIRPRPGAEVWAEAVTAAGAAAPALVVGRYGAGRVAVLAFDEIWRWRRDEGNARQTRFWNQLALALMEAPFSVRDRRVSVDAGPPVQEAGRRTHLRARVRDERGRAMAGAIVQAQVFHAGRRIAALPMTPDERGSGLYVADIGPLAPGEYELRVTVAGVPESETAATVSWVVRPPTNLETAEPAGDDTLMRQIASVSRGRYFREEQIGELAAVLRPLSRGRMVETETHLWQRWPWFTAIMALLTAEWVIRKRRGLL